MRDVLDNRDLAIRDAQPDDVGLVESLYGQMTPDVSNVARDFAALVEDPNAVCWILEKHSQPVGMLLTYARASLSSGRKLVVDELVIDREHRGHGYGTVLLDRCIAHAKGEDYDCIELACSLVKPELHRYYELAGFRHRMRLYSMFLQGDD